MRNFRRKLRPASCNLQSEIYNLNSFTGVLAQLVERLNGIEEVRGSNPLGSTFYLTRTGRMGPHLPREDFPLSCRWFSGKDGVLLQIAQYR